MSVINSTLNQRGIQSLGLEFQSTVGAGHGYMVYHTNGRVYCVFARNYLNGVQERRIYISYSTDGGNAWSTPVQLTSGKWDDNPCALQLDTSSTNSDIGIIFTRVADIENSDDQILYRIGINPLTFALTTPVDPITNSPAQFKFPSLVKTSSGFALFAISSFYTSSASVFLWTSVSFTTNTWAQTILSNFWGSSTLNPFSLSVRRLSNGHFGAISCVRTSLDGSTLTGVGNLPRANVRTDVYVSFSDDEGATWSTPQNLTGYSGTPPFDLVGLTIAFDSDLIQLSNGTIVVAYQEGNGPQFLNQGTALAVPSGAGSITAAVYHPGKNYLILGTDDATNGGVFIFDLTAQTRTRLSTTSTPPLWGNIIQDLALSFDNKYLVVAHTLGLEIIDTTNSSIASWTVTPLRAATTPATRSSNMKFCRFDTSGYLVYVSYGAQTAAGVWGFIVDASNPIAVTDLTSNTGGGIANARFFINTAGIISIPVGGFIEQINKANGSVLHSTNFSGGTWSAIVWDDLNSEIIAAGSNGTISGLHRITLPGSNFVIQQSFGPATNPAVPSSLSATSFVAVPGIGCYYHDSAGTSGSEGFYSFGQQQPLGFVSYTRDDQALGENVIHGTLDASGVIKSGQWLLTSSSGNCQLVDLKTSGRLRYGFFTYDSIGKQLVTSGVNFYDMTNLARVGNAATGLQKVRIAVDADDTIYVYIRKVDLTVTRNQYAAMNGHVEPDAHKIFMRARIRNTIHQSIQIRARIRTNPTRALQSKCLIVFAQCFKIRAHITPRTVNTVSLRARINSLKTTTLLNTYLVSREQTSQIRMTFFAGAGDNGLQTLSFGARIAKNRAVRLTHHFIVYNNRSGPLNLQFFTSQTTLQTATMKARIIKP